MQPNRLVAILTPLVFAPVAAFITLKLADLGIDFGDSTDDLIIQGSIFAFGAFVAWAKSQQWLKGWQGWEKQVNDATNGALDVAYKEFLEDLAAKAGVPTVAERVAPQEVVGEPDPNPPPAFEPGAFKGVE